MCTAHFWGSRGGVVWYPRGVGYPGEVGYPGGRIYPPTPQKKYGTRDTLPPEKIWDKGPGGDLAPEILYPPVDRQTFV